MIDWPKSLIPEVAERRCVIFLGAGASHTSLSADGTKHPPLWGEFLAELLAAMQRNVNRSAAEQLIEKENYLDAAEIIRADINEPDYIQLISRIFRDPDYKPSPLHEVVRDLDVKTVITTNYDKIYERCCEAEGPGYNTCIYYQDHLVNDIKSSRRVIVKAHGCVSDAVKTVLTRNQYFRARKEHGHFYHVLDALFVTNTLLFIGYSLGDPDIRLILENVNIAAPSACPHYAIVEEGQHEALKAAVRASSNVRFLEHTAGRYNEIVDALKKLQQDVDEYRATHP